MDDADRDRIQQQLPDLLQAVKLTDEFTSQLLRLRVLTHDLLEELEAERLPRDRLRRLLLEVTHRGPYAFNGLVRALLETGQLQAARLLRPTLSLADLSPAAAAALSPPQVQERAAHCVPTTPAHQPLPQPAWRPPAEPQPLPLAVGDGPPPGPNLVQVQPAESYLGTPQDSYLMMSQPRGLALVVSNIDFKTDLHDERTGGEVDEKALLSLLPQLGFRVELKRNLNHLEMLTAIAAFAKRDEHKMYDMAVLAVLTHGGEHVLFGVDSRPIAVEKVINCFSHEAAPHLSGKPKWMLFQACRGHEGNRAMRLMDPNRQATDGQAMSAEPATHQKAEFGDIFITYSSIPGYVSMRDLDQGTWLVQVLCEVFAKFAHSHTLQDLHRMVHDRMDRMITSRNEKQTIETSQRGWRRKLYFNPGL